MNIEVILLSLLISFLWGISPIIHKFIFNNKPISPITMMVSGSAIYFACSFIYFTMNRKVVMNDLKNMDRTTLFLLIFGAIIAGFFANLLYFRVIKNHASYLVSALVFSSPFFTLLFSYFLLKEEINLTSMLGVMLIVLGVILLAWKSKPKTVAKMKDTSITRTSGPFMKRE